MTGITTHSGLMRFYSLVVMTGIRTHSGLLQVPHLAPSFSWAKGIPRMLMTMFSIKIKIKGRTVIMSAANPIVAMLISSASYRRPPTASFLKNATSSSSLSVPASPPTGRQWQQDGIHCRYTATCFFLKNVTRASSLSVPASPPTGKQWQQDGIHCGYTATCFLLRKQPAPPCCLYQQPHPQARNGSKTGFTGGTLQRVSYYKINQRLLAACTSNHTHRHAMAVRRDSLRVHCNVFLLKRSTSASLLPVPATTPTGTQWQ